VGFWLEWAGDQLLTDVYRFLNLKEVYNLFYLLCIGDISQIFRGCTLTHSMLVITANDNHYLLYSLCYMLFDSGDRSLRLAHLVPISTLVPPGSKRLIFEKSRISGGVPEMRCDRWKHLMLGRDVTFFLGKNHHFDVHYSIR